MPTMAPPAPQGTGFAQVAQQVAAQQPQGYGPPPPQAIPSQPSPVMTPEVIAANAQQHAFASLAAQIQSQAAQMLPGMQQTAPAATYTMAPQPGYLGQPQPGVSQGGMDLARLAGVTTGSAVQGMLPSQPQPGQPQAQQPYQHPPLVPMAPQAQMAQPGADPIQQFTQHSTDAQFAAGLGGALEAIGQGLAMEGHMV